MVTIFRTGRMVMFKKIFQTRRDFLVKAGGTGLGLWLAGVAPFALAGEDKSSARQISPVEDLMREHGALRRVLLIYDEIGRRLSADTEPPAGVLTTAADIIRRFVEEYHEKLEETELFPRFEKAGKMVDLVKVLWLQHQVGRKITAAVLSLATPAALADAASRRRLQDHLHQFTRMYRPHAAREDTVLFPAFPALLPQQEYQELGEKFEDKEQQLFGKNGFENIVSQIADLEKQLGINDLAQFTPKI
jgi:hemerythrin-like domain-containing protein